MRYPKTAYEEAIDNLEYVKTVQTTLCGMLDNLVSVNRSGMLVSARDYDCAVESIREAIEEMYYQEIREARKIKEGYEREYTLKHECVTR